MSGQSIEDLIDEIQSEEGIIEPKTKERLPTSSKNNKMVSIYDEYINYGIDAIVAAIIGYLVYKYDFAISIFDSIIPGLTQEVEEKEISTSDVDKSKVKITKVKKKKSTLKGDGVKGIMVVVLFTLYKVFM